MYKQSLVNTVEPIKRTTITRMNRGKKWKYGYNKEHDLIVLSRNGIIGEIIEIQNLVIALPKEPKKIYKHPKNKWVKQDYPKELQRIKNIFDWRNYPDESKEKWFEYIDEELIKVAKEAIVDSGDDITADRLKNAAATKKLAIFDAFEILNRIQEEENILEGKEPEEKKERAFKGFAEGRSK